MLILFSILPLYIKRGFVSQFNGYVTLHVCVFPSQGILFHFVVIVITVCGSFRVERRVVYVRIVVVGKHWDLTHFFPDAVLLYVTDRYGTNIASTQVVLYKCGAAIKYVLFRLIDMVVICFCIGVMGERVAKVVDRWPQA